MARKIPAKRLPDAATQPEAASADVAAARLQELADPAVAKFSATFFKTGPGQYGEGDVFLGIRVPVLRRLAREFRSLPLDQVERLLHSPLHEQRLLALIVLVDQAATADAKTLRTIYDFYLASARYVNNWDLVDTSAPQIVGRYLMDKSRKPLFKLAKSHDLWERRIAIVATHYFIRHDDHDDTVALAEVLLDDRQDLMHKAIGWMLREVGKRDQTVLEQFLVRHAARMPRTMLRYAIERFPAEQRLAYLKMS